MKKALFQSFRQDFSRAVIIGSDIPDLPGEIINKAFLCLQTHDAVIGPSSDGGYYLIGFSYDTFLPEAFDGINWGTHKVYQKTLNRLKNTGHQVGILPKWSDIDTYDDLKDLIIRNQNTAFHYSHTLSYLSKIGVVLK